MFVTYLTEHVTVTISSVTDYSRTVYQVNTSSEEEVFSIYNIVPSSAHIMK